MSTHPAELSQISHNAISRIATPRIDFSLELAVRQADKPKYLLKPEITVLLAQGFTDLRKRMFFDVCGILKVHIWTAPAKCEAVKGVRFSERGAKMKDEHLVPLSHQAVALQKQVQAISGESVFVFPGALTLNKTMSENTINKALRVMGYDTKTEVCGHGFRTMACSALNESGRWSKDAIERQDESQSAQRRTGCLRA